MARGRKSHGGGGGALLACNRAIDREDDYKKNVKALHIRAKALAESLRPDGRIAEVLQAESDGTDAADFLRATHDKLKAIAEGNAKRMYDIEYFVDAVKEIRTQVENSNKADEGDGEGGDAADAPDYERSLTEAMERIREEREGDPSRPAPEDHELSTQLREALGEKVQKKRSRSSRGGDDEDDLEIVHNRTDDVNALKCPITGMLFEDPVVNKQCHHTYERVGLNQLLSNRKFTCPVPGCPNKSLSLSQVEDDEEMKLRVKRHKVREEAERKKRQLEEDDDMEEGDGDGYTVLE